MSYRRGCVASLLVVFCARADEVPGRCFVQYLNWEGASPDDPLIPAHCEGVDLSWSKVRRRLFDSSSHRTAELNDRTPYASSSRTLPRHTPIRAGNLLPSQIGDKRVKELSKALAIGCEELNCLLPVSYLDLSRTNMGDRGLKAVGDLMRRNPPIEELRLDSNFFSAEVILGRVRAHVRVRVSACGEIQS